MSGALTALVQGLAGAEGADGAELESLLGRVPGLDLPALGWALKSACYEAWSTTPSLTSRYAALLTRLHELHPVPDLRALADWTRGVAALAEGRAGDSIPCFDSASETFAALGDRQHAAETLVPKQVALAMLGRDADALALAKSVREAFLATGDLRSAGKVELNLGTMLSRGDRFAEAAQHYRGAAVRFARVGDDEHSIMADIGLADALAWASDLDEARFVSLRARERARSRGFLLLQGLAALSCGSVEMLRGQHFLALRSMAAASELLEQAGASPQRRLESDAALADAYAAVGLLIEAVRIYGRVIDRAVELDATLEEARARAERARARLQLHRFDAALDDLRHARTLFERLENPTSTALVDLYLGEIHLLQGRAQHAAGCARAARAALEDAGILGWQLEARLLEASADWKLGALERAHTCLVGLVDAFSARPHLETRALVVLASIDQRLGRFDDSRRRVLRALDLVDEQRAVLPGDEFRSAIATHAEAASDLLIELTLHDTFRSDADVLAAMDRGRARSLWMNLWHSDPEPNAQSSALPELGLMRQRQIQSLATRQDASVAMIDREIRALEHELLDRHRRQQLLGASAPAALPSQAPGGALNLAEALDDDTAWVQYHLTSERLLACVVTSDGYDVVPLEREGIEARIGSLRFQLESHRFGAPQLARLEQELAARARGHLERLYHQLWAPLVPEIGSRRRVVVVPHRELNYVPFCALHDAGRWLLERHEVSIAPSVEVWRALEASPQQRGRSLFAIGHDDGRLPEVGRELDAIVAAYGAPSRTARNGDATAAALREWGTQADILHFACHGEFRGDYPSFSSLTLADGPLALHDLSRLRLAARLVVLSACETGISRIAPGGELLGLVRGFIVAGAKTVIASQWSVNDQATATLMARLYAELAVGASPAAALRAAQLEGATSGRHPYFWAAFAAYGRS